ncbi:ATP-binding protein [Ureaplasma diversum]|uniref:Ribosome biogenesis GTPase A n=2 Tax=Ureaplasma diversum TaxID=42094 RepID=A0A084EZR2_9BACT|nr:ribosome biogenesis GTPase YlqF [Ureaplasma diversum]AJQ45632.1 ATP-binding protein [Ureaplasma diversum]KEZ23454.1 GTP binding protein [Ureaplasma diversum NCTC 246]
MENNKLKINWFPGHMKKALEQINAQYKNIDFVIEVLDARCIKTSHNSELVTAFVNKPIIKIALKQDLSTIKSLDDLLVGSTKNKAFKNEVIKALYNALDHKIKQYEKKGLVNPRLVGLVVGLPNVGKSSLINFLANKNQLKTENRPGVTKNQSLKQINQHFYLIDTPGVFFKDVSNYEDGYKLVLINCVRKEVVNLYDVIQYAYQFYSTFYFSSLKTKYQLNEMIDFDHFLDHICTLYHFKLVNNTLDYERALNALFNDFSSGLVCSVNYDQ